MQKIKHKKRNYNPQPIIGISLVIIVIICGIIFVVRSSAKHHTATLSAQKLVQSMQYVISGEPIPYSTSPYRYTQNAGAYMRPIKPTGYKFLVFPTHAYLLTFNSDPQNEQKIESLLGKGFTKKVLADKSVQTAVEYDANKVVCYLEIPAVSLDHESVFGCADKSSYAENALKIAPILANTLTLPGDGAYDTPTLYDSPTPGFATALVPTTFTPGLVEPSKQDPLQRYMLSSINMAFYKSPTSSGWKMIGYGGYRSNQDLCTSPYSQDADIQTAIAKLCTSQ